MKFRSEVVAQLKSNYYDVCVIGGGASGAGCALDAQLRGLKTVVLGFSRFWIRNIERFNKVDSWRGSLSTTGSL